MFRYLLLACLICQPTWVLAAEPDARWPDFGVDASGAAGLFGAPAPAQYFQGFESPCFGPPYSPAPDDDWIRFFSEVERVASGTGGIPSHSGQFHAQLTPPLPSAPGSTRGAFTRLGGYRSSFDGGFIVELEVYLDLADPQVASGINADYGFDVASAVNNQSGGHRRDFIFHAASNSSGQILIGSSNTTNFAPRGDLAAGPHFVVGSSGWYTLQWVFRDNGDGTLAVDTNLLGSGGVLWTRTLNNPADVIATEIGGNRYLWVLFHETDRLPIDNSRLNSGILAASFGSTPMPGSTLNLGGAPIGMPAAGASLLVQSSGSLQLELCSCDISGPAAADFSVSGCPAIIEPGASATLALGCTPTATGPRSAVLSISTNDSAGGPVFQYPLVCNAGGGPVSMVPTQQPSTLWLLAAVLGVLGVFSLRRMR